MIDHIEARTYASARSDGELDASLALALDAHLEACTECADFGRGIATLSAAVRALPRERAPQSLGERVLRELLRTSPRLGRRRIWGGLAPALAVVVVGMIVFALVVQPGRFSVPGAEAASALSRIDSMVMEREIRRFAPDGTTQLVTTEKIWFSAPASTRIEREVKTFGPSVVATAHELEISVPGKRYVKSDATEYVEINTAPSATSLPEPFSPALAFFGTRLGDGPVVAGRRTIRVVLETPGARREALIDAERFAVVGDEEAVVLAKTTFGDSRPTIRKRTTRVEYNVVVARSRFSIPTIRGIDYGFRTRPPEDLTPAPRALPRGFAVVRSGRGPEGEAVLLSRGAFSILIEIQPRPQTARVDETARPVEFGGHDATIIVGLYSLPRITFEDSSRGVTISAALPADALLKLADELY